MKDIVIISASPRKGGNSDLLCDQFMKGALEAGHKVEKLPSRQKHSPMPRLRSLPEHPRLRTEG